MFQYVGRQIPSNNYDLFPKSSCGMFIRPRDDWLPNILHRPVMIRLKNRPEQPYASEKLRLRHKEVIWISTSVLEGLVTDKLIELGAKWSSGPYSRNHLKWHIYSETLCYEPFNGMYCNLEYYSTRGYCIITARSWLARFDAHE